MPLEAFRRLAFVARGGIGRSGRVMLRASWRIRPWRAFPNPRTLIASRRELEGERPIVSTFISLRRVAGGGSSVDLEPRLPAGDADGAFGQPFLETDDERTAFP